VIYVSCRSNDCVVHKLLIQISINILSPALNIKLLLNISQIRRQPFFKI
jgi:hypothetical protein